MSRLFYHVMQDNAGNLLFDVSGTMRLAGTGTVATIYGDEALTVILPNPMTNHASFGSFKCFLGAGDYDFYMAKSGYNFETLTGVQGHGTMAQQNAANVAITGGTLENITKIRMGIATEQAAALDVYWNRSTQNALITRPTNDVGAFYPVGFLNAASEQIGSITQTGSAVAYNTTSDVRLKFDVEDFIGALNILRQLRPVAFRWRADNSAGEGFLGHELQQVVPQAVTGQPDEINEDGSIKPQQVDHSKLVPMLVSAVKELLARVEVLEQALA